MKASTRKKISEGNKSNWNKKTPAQQLAWRKKISAGIARVKAERAAKAELAARIAGVRQDPPPKEVNIELPVMTQTEVRAENMSYNVGRAMDSIGAHASHADSLSIRDLWDAAYFINAEIKRLEGKSHG